MIPGVNPRQMQRMMKQMGMSQSEIDATEVIIKLADRQLVFTNPNVSKVDMMGQETYQIVGEAHERELTVESDTPEISDDDIKTVMEQANVDEEKAREAIEESNGDLAEAIIKLSENNS